MSSLRPRIAGCSRLSWRKRVEAGRPIAVPVLDFGFAQILLLPGESYVEFQLAAQRMRPKVLVCVAGYGDGATGYMDYPPGHVEGFPDTFKMLFRNVYGTIRGDAKVQPMFATVEDGHQEVAVCEAIIKSNKTRKWTKV